MRLIKCYQTNSKWFKETFNNSRPVGILWHETAGGNPYISRYVQPLESDSNYQEMIDLLGKNKYNNDWNHIVHGAGVNVWIGKLTDGSVATVQAGEWTSCPWGCGAGPKGSCNGYARINGKDYWQLKHWIQFEICDDAYQSKEYFDKVYKEACELTAYLCKEFKIDPFGVVEFNGVSCPTILCHKDSHDYDLGGNHSDVIDWFNVFGKTMDDVRNDVAELMGLDPVPDEEFGLLDKVKIKDGVTTYSNGKNLPSWVITSTLYVRDFRSNDQVVISTVPEGAITGIVFEKDLELIEKYQDPDPDETDEPFDPDIDIEEDPIPEPEINPNPQPDPEIIPDPKVDPENTDSDPEPDDNDAKDDNNLTEDEQNNLIDKFMDFINCLIDIIVRILKKK